MKNQTKNNIIHLDKKPNSSNFNFELQPSRPNIADPNFEKQNKLKPK